MKKVNIITIHDLGNNYGSTLQACALCEFIAQEGYDVKLIDYKPKYTYNRGRLAQFIKSVLFFKDVVRQHKRFEKYFKEHCTRTKRYKTFTQLQNEKNDADIYVVGSDQLWNEFYNAGKDPSYYLEFTNCKNKIAYSASLGQLHTNDELLRIKQKTKDFRKIAVREKASYNQLQEIGMVDVEHVLDPVFLFDKEYYIDKDFKKPFEHYLLVYSVNDDELMNESVQEIAKKYGLKVVLVGGYIQKTYRDLYLRGIGPRDFTNLIYYADYVVANSFHATALSIILNKQFSVVLSKNSPLRIEDILSVAGISERVIENSQSIEKAYKTIDYTNVNNRINSMRDKSKQILRSSLELCE